MKISRDCECGPKALVDGDRCAKCGKSLPVGGAFPAFASGSPRAALADPTARQVSEYERRLEEAEPVRRQMVKEGRL